MKKTIILAAGQGKRLLPYTQGKPKCLVEIQGRPILGWQLLVLLSQGIEEIVVMVGYRAQEVEEYLKKEFADLKIHTLYNPDYATTDNLWTCWLASPEMNKDFLLLNGDTLFEPQVLKRLLLQAKAPATITINRKESYDEDDMKVISQRGRLLEVGKGLDLSRVNGESIGLLAFLDEGPRIFRQILAEMITENNVKRRWFLSAVNEMARRYPVWICDITGLSWCEIDFPQDLKDGEKVVQKIKDSLSLG